MKRIGCFLENHPELRGVSATSKEVAKAEEELKIMLDDDYKESIARFGGFYAGVAVHAFSNASDMGRETVIELTNRCRNSFRESDYFDEINGSLVFSDDGAGNPITINSSGQVVIYYHDSGYKEVLSESFESFIEKSFVEW